MKRSLLVCLLAASIAAPTTIHAATVLLADSISPWQGTAKAATPENDSVIRTAPTKPGKSKKYKKKMSKQMKKRKRH